MPLVLSRDCLKAVLHMGDCIETLRTAHIEFSSGHSIMPLRLTAPLRDAGLIALMPAWLDKGPLLGVKVITNFPGNRSRDLPAIAAIVLLLDAHTGLTMAIMDGAFLTEIRTAAASAVATDELARPNASRLALIGAGVQARSHLEAMAAVRTLSSVRVVARTIESATRFIDEQRDRYPGVIFDAVRTGDEAVRDADLVCTVSSAGKPVIPPTSVAPGTHINGVGSHTPQTREIPGETMRDARVIVDSRDATLRESGDCMIPIAEGLFDSRHVSDELGELLAGEKAGRLDDDQVTIYKSCGIAIQDVATANLAYHRALAAGAGVEIEL